MITKIRKKIQLLLFICLALCCTAILVACSLPSLAAPTGVRVEEAEMTLVWDKITYAEGYVVEVNGKRINVSDNSYDFSVYQAGEYTFRVKASGDGKTAKDSAWSEAVTYTKLEESGLTYSLINNKTEYALTGLGTLTGDIVVDAVYRGKPVTAVADSAFAQNGKLTGITLPSSVTTVGTRSFYNCTYLAYVDMPGVTSIGEYAFQSCASLEELTLPDGLTSIPQYAFSYCRRLQRVTFGSQLTQIGQSAFSDCNSLEAVELTGNVQSVGESAFANCTALSAVTLGDNVSYLGASAFRMCTSLERLTLGKNIGNIASYTFSGCTSLTAVTMPENLLSISSYAFSDCTALVEVTTNDRLQSVAQYAFKGAPLTTNAGVVYAGNWVIGGSSAELAEIALQGDTTGIADAAFKGYQQIRAVTFTSKLTYVGASAFYGCTNLISVVMPDDCAVVSLGDYAFYGCTLLRQVKVGKRLESIGSYCFANCELLTNADSTIANNLILPSTLKTIGTYAFIGTALWESATDVVYVDTWVVGCKNNDIEDVYIQEGTVGIANYAFYKKQALVSVTLPNSLKLIGRSAFYQCSALAAVAVPSSVKEISDYAFYGCSSLLSLSLPEGVVSIGRSSFYQCSGLGYVTLPDTLESIGEFAFFNCTDLLSVSFGSGLTDIGSKAFYGCSSLTDLSLPSALVAVGQRAFQNCISLKNVDLGGTQQIGDYAFRDCTALTFISLPDSVETVGSYAFYGCSSLAAVELGSGVKEIGNYAFYNCNLQSLVIPYNVAYVGNQAFRGNAELSSVILTQGLTETGSHVFYGCNSLTVYTAYAAAPSGWNSRWNSSYRPVAWGSTLSEDGSYVISFVASEGGMENYNAVGGISAPIREGYAFLGWSSRQGSGEAEYTSETVSSAPAGITLYAVWEALS